MRLLNNLKENNKLADHLTNKLPRVKAAKLFCSEYAYDIVKKKNIENINHINKYLRKEEFIAIEKKEDVTISETNKQTEFFSSAEIKIILEFFIDFFNQNSKNKLIKKNKLVENINVNYLRNIATSIESGRKLSITDALFLMKIAQNFRPDGPFINKKIKEWKKKIH